MIFLFSKIKFYIKRNIDQNDVKFHQYAPQAMRIFLYALKILNCIISWHCKLSEIKNIVSVKKTIDGNFWKLIKLAL